MTRSVLPVLAFFFAASVLHARLGETVEQCTERYGPIVEKRHADLPQSDPDSAVFSKSGVSVIVEFHEGKAWRIIFRKPGMLASEIEVLLQSNAGSGAWSEAMPLDGWDYRVGDEGRRIAIVNMGGRDRKTAQVEFLDRAYAKQRYANHLEGISKPGAAQDILKKTNPLPGF